MGSQSVLTVGLLLADHVTAQSNSEYMAWTGTAQSYSSPWTGTVAITNVADCQAAHQSLNLGTWWGSYNFADSAGVAGGCVYHIDNGNMYFNTNTGTSSNCGDKSNCIFAYRAYCDATACGTGYELIAGSSTIQCAGTD